MKSLLAPNFIQKKRFYKKSHHGKISKSQIFAIREIENVSQCKFKGLTRYHASIFISFFLDNNRTIYPEGRSGLFGFRDKDTFLSKYLLLEGNGDTAGKSGNLRVKD